MEINQAGVQIYEPNQRLKTSIFMIWVVMLRNIIASRELIWQLFRRDFLMQYKKSFIGMGWILVSPILGIVSWVFMNQTGILAPGDVGIPYPAYVLLSSSIWGLFMGFYGAGTETLSAGMGFIKQVRYPHEALLVKQAAQYLANFSITFVINIIVLLGFGIVPDWKIVLFPLVILPIFFLGASIGLIISIFSVVATDIYSIAGKVLALVFYITPVIYADEPSNELLSFVIQINPLTYLIGGARDLIIYGHIDYFDRYILVSVVVALLFFVSWRFFYVSEDRVIERMI